MKLTKKEAATRLPKLRDLINDYRYQLNVHDKSTMSEAAADSLKHELTEIEAAYPELITPDSPSQRVAGEPLPGFDTVEHRFRMLSLNDVFNEKEVEAWTKRITKLAPADSRLEFFMDLKMDGLACALIYENGELQTGVTRGDGFVGENVTANIRTIESIPLKLRVAKGYEKFLDGRTEVRGEIVMYKEDFEALNRERAANGLPLYANPRNLAAGTIRQLDPKLVAARPLQLHVYDLLREDGREVASYEHAYEALRQLGFRANKETALAKTTTEIMDFAKKWETKRHDLPFNTDGMVIKVNDRELYANMGIVGKAPRAAVAFKYPAEQATTRVIDIFVSIGRTGAATPVAMLKPVVVAGSTVQMATLHNEGEVRRKDIRIGDTVIIHKAGDIIPEIVQPLIELRDGSETKFVMPKKCPECSTKLIKTKAADAVWRCPNESCPSRSWKRIEHYASKAALDIEGLGEKNIIALVSAGLVKDQADIYKVRKEDLLKLDRFAEVSASKLVAAIQAKTKPPLARFVYGLGIRHVGVQTAIDLSNYFLTIEAISSSTVDELSSVEGVGEVVAESVVEWFLEPSNQKLMKKFEANGVRPVDVKKVGGPLSGKNFVITGSLESMSRDQAADRIRALGGTFQGSIGKDTDYLVVGANVGASKLAKAAKLGTEQITEQQLLDMLTSKA